MMATTRQQSKWPWYARGPAATFLDGALFSAFTALIILDPATTRRGSFGGETSMLEMTGQNLARLLRGLTIVVGHRKNRILLYQFLAAEIRALHYSYGVGDSESYKRALTFLENCKRLTLRSMVRKSAERHIEIIDNHARRVLLRALKKLDASQPWETYVAVYPSEGWSHYLVHEDRIGRTIVDSGLR